MTKQQLLSYLTANPEHEVVKHPNPAGLGPRRFAGMRGRDFVFVRPNPAYATAEPWARECGLVTPEAESFLPADNDAKLTDDGFTIMGGRVACRRVD